MRLLKSSIAASGVAGALLASSALAAAPVRVDVAAGPLGAALSELARENGVEVLFTEALVRDQRARALKGRMTPAEALTALLAGSGLTYRSTSDGVFVVTDGGPPARAEAGEGAIAEVLVVGRRTQNADIRRTQNDIQPYSILDRQALASAPQETIDQVLRARVPANAQGIAPSQWVPGGPYPNSAVDLRGVGVQRTLVLIDGRRLPSLPTSSAGLNQADLNALPLGAIERIETLTATAGGIYGFSAIGGAVNVVLRRDYRGAEVMLGSGVSGHGDAGWGRTEARLGFTPDGGQTDVMLAAAYARRESLQVGDRRFANRARALIAANDPHRFVQRGYTGDGIIVRSSSGRPLQLDPAYGGTRLESAFTFLPLDFGGDASAKSEALVSNGGKLPADVAPGRAGKQASLLPEVESFSALLNVRRPVSEDLEVFLDGLYFQNRGETVTAAQNTGGFAAANAPTNPFTEAVYFAVPVPGFAASNAAKIDTRRLTAGVIASLPRRWRASFDVTLGETNLSTSSQGRRSGLALSDAFVSGTPGPGGAPAVDALGDFAALQSAMNAYAFDTSSDLRLTTEFRNASLRAAGPLMELPAGPLTLTVLGEARRERIPESASASVGERGPQTLLNPERIQEVGSGYVELRAPLQPTDRGLRLTRGLELQLALRHDDLRTTFPENINFAALELGDVTIRHRANVFTFGARTTPVSWLMLRGGVATGEAPPDLRHLQQRGFRSASPLDPATDPKRGDRPITLDGPYFWVRNGFHGIEPEKGRTVSAGVVLNPSGRTGPRVSIDYARVDVRDEIIDLRLSPEQVIAMEDRFPERVVREPLSPADGARGFSAGRITAVHTGMINAGRLMTETIDLQGDWTLPPSRFGDVRLHGAVTWQPTFRRRGRLDGPIVETIALQDTPLEWRGNAGLQWIRGALTLDLNLQYFGDHSLDYSPGSVVLMGPERIAYQGATRVPSQIYFDLSARRTFDLAPGAAAQSVEVRVEVQNLFDRSPPTVADPTNVGYDYYGDPRGRRFELQVSARF